MGRGAEGEEQARRGSPEWGLTGRGMPEGTSGYSQERLEGRALEHGLVATLCNRAPGDQIRMLRRDDPSKPATVEKIAAPETMQTF